MKFFGTILLLSSMALPTFAGEGNLWFTMKGTYVQANNKFEDVDVQASIFVNRSQVGFNMSSFLIQGVDQQVFTLDGENLISNGVVVGTYKDQRIEIPEMHTMVKDKGMIVTYKLDWSKRGTLKYEDRWTNEKDPNDFTTLEFEAPLVITSNDNKSLHKKMVTPKIIPLPKRF